MRSVTALQHLEEGVSTQRLSVGCRVLDACLGGGIPARGITEIAGEAGAGKTQFALTLSLQCCLPPTHGGLGGKTVYLCCGEGEFPNRRLVQLATSLSSRACFSSQAAMLDSVTISQCHNADDVMDALKKNVPAMCAKEGVRLLVIDSIAGMVRNDYATKSVSDMAQRTVLLFKIAKELKWLADIYNVCVVVINQVTGKGFENGSSGSSSCSSSSSSGGQNDSSPALGLAWSHCVNTRICLRRDTVDMRCLGQPRHGSTGGYGEGDNNEDGGTGNHHPPSNVVSQSIDGPALHQNLNQPSGTSRSRRTLTVEFSPSVPRSLSAYEISPDGVFGLILN